MARSPLQGPFVWTGAELANRAEWRIPLTRDMLAEIDAALATVRRRGLGWDAMRREDFPLEETARLLARVADALEDGCGVVKLSGLPVGDYDEPDIRRLWYGLALHLGRPVSQSNAGLRMKIIRDEGATVGLTHGQMIDPDGSAFLSSYARAVSNGALRFHTDRTDVVGLLCVGQASEGGLSKIASTVAIHNEILRRRPDLLELLYRPYPRSKLGEEKGGDRMVYELPVFGVRDGRFTSHYSRTYIEACQKLPEVPKLSAAQEEALDLMAEIAESICYRMVLAPGDIQLLNNHVIYHARGDFRDDPASGKVRQLYRIWLAMPNSRALPEDHAVLWGDVSAGAVRGGIAVAGA
ncbi:MAG: TauD/TfdA family dioxygenase [Dongiaceae bacterium]